MLRALAPSSVLLFPLAGFDGAGSLSRAHAIRAGVALKF